MFQIQFDGSINRFPKISISDRQSIHPIVSDQIKKSIIIVENIENGTILDIDIYIGNRDQIPMSEENITQYKEDIKAIELAIEDLKSEYNQKKQDAEAKSAAEYDSVENHEGVTLTTATNDLAGKTETEGNTSEAYIKAKAELKEAQSTVKESEKNYKKAIKEQGKRAERLLKDLDSELSNKTKEKQNEIKVFHKQIKNDEKEMAR